ncbi:MAG: HAMP domain-containing histidine kinase [Candidatus Omnitrophica bacterium]|nr:HAMP domain-containing histidine kinase [Candidatus Omnitrophota bacterium]
MKLDVGRDIDKEIKEFLGEIRENPYRVFNVAFFLIGIVPFSVLVFFFARNVLATGDLPKGTALAVGLAMILMLAGYHTGYSMLRRMLAKIIAYGLVTTRREKQKALAILAASHELGNPLTSIRLSLANILDGLVGKVSEEQKNVISMCHNAAERMTRITKVLLDIIKIEAGIMAPDRGAIDIAGIMRQQAVEFAGLIDGKKIVFSANIPAEACTLWADRDMITQVVNNLFSNAVKFTPERGRIDVSLTRNEKMARIEVADTGPGIAPDKMENIFDKFVRLDKTIPGSGLGLAITKDIIDLHKGKIVVVSEPGKGSRFIVCLPVDIRDAGKAHGA